MASSNFFERGSASALTDSRLMMMTLRMGCLRYPRGGLDRSTAGAESWSATKLTKFWSQVGGGVFTRSWLLRGGWNIVHDRLLIGLLDNGFQGRRGRRIITRRI